MMSRRYEVWIGNRYVRSRSRNSFVSLISGISMLGIAIAVLVLIVVMSVVNGFERELKDRLLAMTAHASIEDVNGRLADYESLREIAERNPRVSAAAPYIEGQALLVAGLSLSGAELRGVEPQFEDAVSGIGDVMYEGQLESLASWSFNIVLGIELAEALGVKTGDKVTVTLAEGRVTPAGVIPRTKRFTVSGIYRVGMYEFDRRLAFINLEDAQRLYRKKGAVTGIRLAVTEIYAAPDIVREVAREFEKLVLVSDWTRVHVNFFRSIQITKSILFVILLMVAFERNFLLIFVAIGAINWLDMARIVRGQTLSLREREFVEAARLTGVSTLRIIFRHIAPNLIGIVVVYVTLTIPQAILVESFLSFLGLGVQEPQTSLGALVNVGVAQMESAPWMLLIPARLLALILLCFNFLGDGLRDALDPKDR